jgi:hypothetical protein
MDEYEDFYSAFEREKSQHVATVLGKAGVRFRERVDTEIGIEYVIEVHQDDIDQAYDAFAEDLGPGKTFTAGPDGAGR